MKNQTFPLLVTQPMSASALASAVSLVAQLHGCRDVQITHVASPKDAIDGALVFFRTDDPAQLQTLADANKASVVVSSCPVALANHCCNVVTADPMAWFIEALNLLHPSQSSEAAAVDARIASDVVLGVNVKIGPGSVIEHGCVIGDGVTIGAQCFIGSGTKIGHHSFIQNHASIGGVGLGYHIDPNGKRMFFPHLGRVLIGEHVVVGSGTVVVRGQLDDTLIADHCRLGNLVNIGHNVQLAEAVVISSNSCVAGGVRIGAHCQMGIGVMINAKISLGEKSRVGMGSVVTKDYPAGAQLFGNPARILPTMGTF